MQSFLNVITLQTYTFFTTLTPLLHGCSKRFFRRPQNLNAPRTYSLRPTIQPRFSIQSLSLWFLSVNKSYRLRNLPEYWISIFTLTSGTTRTIESFGVIHQNSVRISFLPAQTRGHPIWIVLYGIVSNAVPLLPVLSTHTFHNCIMWQANPELCVRHLIPFCFSWYAYKEGRN